MNTRKLECGRELIRTVVSRLNSRVLRHLSCIICAVFCAVVTTLWDVIARDPHDTSRALRRVRTTDARSAISVQPNGNVLLCTRSSRPTPGRPRRGHRSPHWSHCFCRNRHGNGAHRVGSRDPLPTIRQRAPCCRPMHHPQGLRDDTSLECIRRCSRNREPTPLHGPLINQRWVRRSGPAQSLQPRPLPSSHPAVGRAPALPGVVPATPVNGGSSGSASLLVAGTTIRSPSRRARSALRASART